MPTRPARRSDRRADRRSVFSRARWLAAALVAVSAFAPAARADVDAAKLSQLEAEARTLAVNLPVPTLTLGGAVGQRKLTDAQVAYSLGDYDAAALTLFDLANRPGPD